MSGCVCDQSVAYWCICAMGALFVSGFGLEISKDACRHHRIGVDALRRLAQLRAVAEQSESVGSH